MKRLNLIKEKGGISNSALIQIRFYLNQLAQVDSENILDFDQYISDNNIELSKNIKKVLQNDFDYLNDIKRLY